MLSLALKRFLLRDCHATEENVEYWTSKAIYEMEFVMSAKACQDRCEHEDDCIVWTWGKADVDLETANVCFLRALNEAERVWRVPRSGLLSGVPCRLTEQQSMPEPSLAGSGSSGIVSAEDALGVASPASWRFTSFQPGSLFCWALFLPNTYEQELLEMQYSQRASLFACDEYEVYTNRTFELVPGVTTKFVDSDLHCQLGGQYMTAMNNPIFIKAWKAVVRSGTFLSHDWTVKVDTDSVFFPDRLRNIVQDHGDGGNIVPGSTSIIASSACMGPSRCSPRMPFELGACRWTSAGATSEGSVAVLAFGARTCLSTSAFRRLE